MLDQSNINYLWSSLLIEELIRCGVDYFCIAPGSRSAPLAVCAARHPKARHFIHWDERGLAFHALGFAMAKKKPVVLMCTSGTAGANFYPAVIEASKKKVPLIVLTADRPPELRHTGAVQTIDQVGLLGKYVKFQVDLPAPDPAISPRFVLTTVDQAVYQAMRNPCGVVHLNCMFREPLAPIQSKDNVSLLLKDLRPWLASGQPFTAYERPVGDSTKMTHLNEAALQRISHIKNGVIIVGKLSTTEEQNAVVRLAKHLGWPVFPDASSGLRLGLAHEMVIPYFEHILSHASGSDRLTFDGVLHVGGRMTSRRIYEFIAKQSLKEYVMVLNHPLRNDPQHQVTLRIEAPVAGVFLALERAIKSRKSSAGARALIQANRQIDALMEEFFSDPAISESEPHLARVLTQQISAQSVLFVGNSMPLRDLEFYGDFKGNSVDVYGNRGASGIDGLLATAAGLSVGTAQAVTCLLGDLSLLHDLNSLAQLKQLKHPVVIVVFNNDGGSIFSFLPIAQTKDVFENVFATPHGLNFKDAAAMFGLSYANPRTVQEFIRAYRQAVHQETSTLIELTTNRVQNFNIHKRLQALIASQVRLS